jgi:hypothetical protein
MQVYGESGVESATAFGLGKFRVKCAIMVGSIFTSPNRFKVAMSSKNCHILTEGVAQIALKVEHFFIAMNTCEKQIYLLPQAANATQPADISRNGVRRRVDVPALCNNLQVWISRKSAKLC